MTPTEAIAAWNITVNRNEEESLERLKSKIKEIPKRSRKSFLHRTKQYETKNQRRTTVLDLINTLLRQDARI